MYPAALVPVRDLEVHEGFEGVVVDAVVALADHCLEDVIGNDQHQGRDRAAEFRFDFGCVE